MAIRPDIAATNGHMPSWEVQKFRADRGLAPDPTIKLFPFSIEFPGLDRIDAANPKSDATAIAVLMGGIPVEVSVQVGVIEVWANAVFEKKEGKLLDQNRVGQLLKTAVQIKKDPEASSELVEKFDQVLGKSVLRRVVAESGRQRWSSENSKAVLEGYSEFMTLDKKHGKGKAAEIKRQIAEEVVYARQYDLACARASFGQPVIDLPVRGAEVAEVVLKMAVKDVADEQGVKDHWGGYYRSRVLGYDREFGNGGENRGIPSPEQQMSDLLQKEGAPRGAGVELPTGGGTLDKDSEMRQGLGTGQVGGLVCEEVGRGIASRIKVIDKDGIVFDEPKRTDSFREIQTNSKVDVHVITFGDGATSASVPPALEDAAIMRAPVILVCEDNGVAIGTEFAETHSDVPVSELGWGYGIPGITIDSTNYEKLYAAAELAAIWNTLDKGATLLHIKTERIAPHSPSHGHNRIPPIIDATQEILSSQLDRETTEARALELEAFLDDGIFAPSLGDTTISARERIGAFVGKFKLDDDASIRLEQVLQRIVDPMEVVLGEMRNEGVITEQDVMRYEESAQKEIDSMVEKVKAKPGPSVEVVGRDIGITFPQIWIRPRNGVVSGRFKNGRGVLDVPWSDEVLTLTGSQAISAVLRAGGEDPGFYNFGIDINKGKEVYKDPKTGKYATVTRGGYQHDNDGVYDEVAHRPGRFRDSRIHEAAVLASAMGEFTQPAHLIEDDFYRQLALMNGDLSAAQDVGLRRAFINFDYADYGIAEAFGTWFRDGGVNQTSGGNFIRPVHTYMHEGMQGVGGPWHCHSMDAATFSLPEGVDVFTISTPEMAFNVMNTLRRFGNSPSITLWAREMWNKEQTWTKGTGLFEPGRDRVVREGGDLQIITYGQSRNKVEEAANKASEALGGASIGVFEKISWRQREAGHTDLETFVREGTGPILIISEEPESRSAGHFISSWLRTRDHLRQYTNGRDIQVMGSVDVSHPYSAPILIEAQRPGVEYLTDKFIRELAVTG
jgi:TPP-dependent pyruvate/acetoin dehydrogenase alpha subunit/pyruvate/2-oxoglutarate/acetoin dehydrogenase E1 component